VVHGVKANPQDADSLLEYILGELPDALYHWGMMGEQ